MGRWRTTSLHCARSSIFPKRRYVPAHGGPIEDGPTFARALLSHRELRNRQVVDGVNGGAQTIEALLKKIYPLLAANLQFAAALTLRAHVEYLADAGEIRVRRGLHWDAAITRLVAVAVVSWLRRRRVAEHQRDPAVQIEHEGFDALTILAEIGEIRQRCRPHGDRRSVGGAGDAERHLLAEADQRGDHGV